MKLMSTKSNDVTLNVQWLYMLLYVCSVFCALWHLGEPELMGAVMIAAPREYSIRSCGSWRKSRSEPWPLSG